MRDKLVKILPIISAVISLLIFLFGNNIYDRIYNNSPNLIMQTNKTNQFIPDDLLVVTKDYYINNKSKPMADYCKLGIFRSGCVSLDCLKGNVEGAEYDRFETSGSDLLRQLVVNQLAKVEKIRDKLIERLLQCESSSVAIQALSETATRIANTKASMIADRWKSE